MMPSMQYLKLFPVNLVGEDNSKCIVWLEGDSSSHNGHDSIETITSIARELFL